MPIINLHYSESLVRRAVLSFWWRTTGPGLLLSFLALCLILCYLVWSGERSWWVGALGTGLALMALMTALVYVLHYRSSMARLRRMKSPIATLELGEERFGLSSDVGTSEMDWSTITEIWRFPDYWLVFFSRAQFVTFPTADLDEGARDFILTKATAAGAKIK